MHQFWSKTLKCVLFHVLSLLAATLGQCVYPRTAKGIQQVPLVKNYSKFTIYVICLWNFWNRPRFKKVSSLWAAFRQPLGVPRCAQCGSVRSKKIFATIWHTNNPQTIMIFWHNIHKNGHFQIFNQTGLYLGDFAPRPSRPGQARDQIFFCHL